MNSKRQTKQRSSLSAQEMVKLTGGKSGLIKIETTKWLGLRSGWQRRFVVTSKDTMFVFDDENSKSQNNSLRLLGYKAVNRYECKGQSWCFSIVPGISNLPPIKFSCLCDQDRKSWMQAIKQLLYRANGVDEKPEPLHQRLARLDMTYESSNGSDSDYIDLEQSVFEPVVPDMSQDNTNLDEYSDSDETDSGMSSLPISQDVEQIDYRPSSKQTATRARSEPLPTPPRMPCPSRKAVSAIYVNVPNLASQEEEDDEYIYPPSLYEQCSMTHLAKSREELIKRLTERPAGTYLIRKSRKEIDLEVLAVNCGNRGVMEVKIYKEGTRVSLNMQDFFNSVEELLKYYSVVTPIPKAGIHLQRGMLSIGEEHLYDEAG